MATITRADWGAPPNTAPWISTPVLELWLHHGVVPFWVGAQAARNLERIARDRGFLGISYSWLTDRVGNEIEGRGWGRQGAHTRGRNSISHALCLVGNLDAHPMPAGMIRGAVRLVRRHRRFGPGRITGPHSAAPGASTACPGRYARAQIPAINRQAASSPAPTKDWFDMADKSDLTEVVTDVVRAEMARIVVAGSDRTWWQQMRALYGHVAKTRRRAEQIPDGDNVFLRVINALDWWHARNESGQEQDLEGIAQFVADAVSADVSAALSELTPEAIAAAIPEDLAGQVADELSARLAG